MEETEGTRIEAKQFLGRGDIYELRVPFSVESIGNWAFAGMRSLTRLWLPARDISWGRGVFDKCGTLRDVYVYDESGCIINEDVCRVMADRLTGVGGLPVEDDFLTDDKWLSAYDDMLISCLAKPADDGFEMMWFGGEEDYDDSTTNAEKYKRDKRLKRVSMVYNRLVQSRNLSDAVRNTLYAYLRKCMPMTAEACIGAGTGGGTGESLEYLRANEPDDVQRFAQFIAAGCVRRENLAYIYARMDGFSAENKSILMDYERLEVKKSSVFDDFSL